MASSCCGTKDQISNDGRCPLCGMKGKTVQIITLKSLLTPSTLESLNPEAVYLFCPEKACEVVYFEGSNTFTTDQLKVVVFQKDPGEDVPVCYCFDWTRGRIAAEIQTTGKSTAVERITEHIKVGRCGCEVNNPQGSCCLGNVRSVIKQPR